MQNQPTESQIQELKEQMKDPIVFTEKTGTVKGKPFSFAHRGHLFDVYRDTHPRVVIVAGRQVEKTETGTRLPIFLGYQRKHTTITYTAPRQEQTTRYVNDRFRKAIRESKGGILEGMISPKRDAKTAIGLQNSSQYYFGSAWADGDALRGISGDIVIFDEVQDITQTAIESIEKSVSHSEIKDPVTELNGRCYFTGTPKQKGSYYDRVLWGQSDQKKWHIDCEECGTEQVMSLKNIMVTGEGTKEERRYFGCISCEKELNRENGRWEATKPLNKMYSGYLFNQLNMPWISANQIWRDYITMDAMTFNNEVLGEFYSGDEQPLTLEDVLACTDKTRSLKKHSQTQTVLGVDYGSGGKSKTIIFIGHPENGKLVIDYAESWQPDRSEDALNVHDQLLHHIANLVGKFNVEKIVGDIGYGSYESQKLYEMYGRMAISCRYVTYANDPRKREYKGFNSSTLQVDRTFSMDKLIDAFHKGNIVVPYKDPAAIEYFFDHWTAIEMKFTESNTGTGKKLYDHRTPDDAFHALNYVREGIHELQNRFEVEFTEREDYQFDNLYSDHRDMPEW